MLGLLITACSSTQPQELGFWDGKYGGWNCVEISAPYKKKEC